MHQIYIYDLICLLRDNFLIILSNCFSFFKCLIFLSCFSLIKKLKQKMRVLNKKKDFKVKVEWKLSVPWKLFLKLQNWTTSNLKEVKLFFNKKWKILNILGDKVVLPLLRWWRPRYELLQRVSQIKTNKARWLFSNHFWPLLSWASFLEATEAVMKIGSSLKPNQLN